MGLIFIADDKPMITKLMERQLQRLGHTVRAFNSVQALYEGITATASLGFEFMPNMVIIDGSLHGVRDGFDYAVQLRTQQRIPVIKVILCASNDIHSDYSVLAPPYDLRWLSKPYTVEELQAAIAAEFAKEYV